MNMEFYRKLPIPIEIKERFPVTAEIEKSRNASINDLKAVFEGKSDKFVSVF